MRAAFTASAYGMAEGLLSIPRLVVGNMIAILAAVRALSLHRRRRRARDGTRPSTSSRRSCRSEAVAPVPCAGRGRLGRNSRGNASATSRRRAVPDRRQRGETGAADRHRPSSRRSRPGSPCRSSSAAYRHRPPPNSLAATADAASHGAGLLLRPRSRVRVPSASRRGQPSRRRSPGHADAPRAVPTLNVLADSTSGPSRIARRRRRDSRAHRRRARPERSASAGKASIDRLQLSTWALLRSQPAGVAGKPLAGNRRHARRQPGRRAADLQFQPADRRGRFDTTPHRPARRRSRRRRAGASARQPFPCGSPPNGGSGSASIGDGRSAFALFAEGGVYERPLPWGFVLDGYCTGGRRRSSAAATCFADGGVTVTRPVYKQFSAGLGVWGAPSPALYRVDAGPRVTMRVRNEHDRVHFDWRQRLAGNARPGSGPAVTLAGDF